MKKTRISLIHGDTSAIEYSEWDRWLKMAGALVDRHLARWPDDDPFAYNETASAAFLSAAAATCGYAALAEFTTEKFCRAPASASGTERSRRPGRGDLCVHTDAGEWAFEFKQHLCYEGKREGGRLLSLLNSARNDAECLIEDNDGKPVAALIISLYYMEKLHDKTSEEIEGFVKSNADYCWRITPPNFNRNTYIIFDRKIGFSHE